MEELCGVEYFPYTRYEMTYYKVSNGFKVTSRSGLKKTWLVTPDIKSCDCPKFIYYLKRQSPCHHMNEVREGEMKAARTTPLKKGIREFELSEYIEPLTIEEFTKIYGDDQLDASIGTYELFIYKGRVRKL